MYKFKSMIKLLSFNYHKILGKGQRLFDIFDIISALQQLSIGSKEVQIPSGINPNLFFQT